MAESLEIRDIWCALQKPKNEQWTWAGQFKGRKGNDQRFDRLYYKCAEQPAWKPVSIDLKGTNDLRLEGYSSCKPSDHFGVEVLFEVFYRNG